METSAMDHRRAIDTQAAARYVLKEMREEEFASYEEHYIGCRECFEQVKFAFDAADAMREVLKTVPVKEETPAFLARFMASLRQPAFGLGLATLILAGMATYQGITIHNITQAAIVQTPTLRPAAKGSNENVVPMPRTGIFTLNFLVDANPSEYASYEARLTSDQQSRDGANGKGKSLQKSFVISADDARNTVGIRLYSGDIAPGNYALTTFGVKKDGSRVELASYYLTLQFGN